MAVTPDTDIPFTTAEAETLLQAWLSGAVHCRSVERLQGGMLHSVVRLRFDRPPGDAVAKLSRTVDEPGFVREAQALEYLHANTHLPCPRVYHLDVSGTRLPLAWLVLETRPGVPLTAVRLAGPDRERVDHELAAALLDLHSHTRPAYGDLQTPSADSWADILLDRLQDMRTETTTRLPARVLADVDAALAQVPEVFADPGPPTLVHGDVWAGNLLVDRRHDGWHLAGFLDPGCHYADVEQELAYLQVFGTVGRAFLDAYTTHSPLRPGYEHRRLFYWLNTWLVHVWIFGDAHYAEQAARTAAAIARPGGRPCA